MKALQNTSNDIAEKTWRKLDETNQATPLFVTVEETYEDGSVTRTLTLEDQQIFFRTIADTLPPPLQTWDFAVYASIFHAMRLNRPLHICGPVSASLLKNMEEFQEAWAVWLPKHLKVVPLSADEEVTPPVEKRNQGVFAFSGGVDATFSLLQHHNKALGRRNVHPHVAVLIKGFDIKLHNDAGFDIANNNVGAMLADLEIPHAVIETNWKADLCYNWRMEHAAGLIACLAQYQSICDVAVIGSDEGYDNIDIPWGSNPVTNPLFSSDAFQVRSEGAGYTRSKRVGFILNNSRIGRYLRVCWENAKTGKNCGRCEKCIRTQLNIRAYGLEPEGFEKKAGLLDITFIPTNSLGDNYFLREIQKTATENGVKGLWRWALSIAIAKNRLLSPYLLIRDRIKSLIRRYDSLYHRLQNWKNRYE